MHTLKHTYTHTHTHTHTHTRAHTHTHARTHTRLLSVFRGRKKVCDIVNCDMMMVKEKIYNGQVSFLLEEEEEERIERKYRWKDKKKVIIVLSFT